MNTQFSNALQLQVSIVKALILQDMSTRYARTRLGALTALLEPVLIVAGTYIIRFYIQGLRTVEGIPMVLFIVTGFMTDFCFRIVVGNVLGAAERRTPSRMFPQVTSLDVILAKATSSSAICAGAMLITFAIASMMIGTTPADMLSCYLAGVLTFALAVSTGLVLGIVARKFALTRPLIGALLRINFVLSGAAFLGTELPQKWVPYVSWNPTFHVIELMREGWFRAYVSPFASVAYVLVFILGFLAVGLPLERLTAKYQTR